MGTETKFNCYSENTVKSLTASSGSLNNCKQSDKLNNGVNAKAATVPVSVAAINIKGSNTEPVFVPIHIDENNVIEGAKEILKVIRPNWDLESVEFKKFTDGITNKLVGCFNTNEGKSNATTNVTNGNGSTPDYSTNGTHTRHAYEDNNDSGNLTDSANDTDTDSASASASDTETDDTEPTVASAKESATNNVVLVRVYGNKTDLLIDRKAETRNIILLHSYGFAPSLYATFKNGLAYDYVPGVTLNTTNVLRPEVWQLVARRMAEMHRIVKTDNIKEIANMKNGDPIHVPMLWKKTQSFFDLVPERFSNAEKHKRLQGTFLPISRMREEFEMLYRRLEKLGSPVVFAHNDLLLGNVVYTESLNTVSFIDYEYADYNFQAFDIGNHFAEFAGVDEVDYTRYPKREFQLQWLQVYLQAYQGRTQVSEDDVERLYVQVNQFALAAHIFWTIWALIQAEHSTIDFDYVDYAYIRYNEYLARKDEFLALELNENGFDGSS